VIAECHTKSKNILNKEIQEYVVMHMRAAECASKQCVQTKNLHCPTLTSFYIDRYGEVINN
jgi:hypothetical protein